MRLVSYLSPGFPRSMFELLGEILGAEVAFEEAQSGPPPGDDPLADGRAQLGWVCSTSYVGLALSSAQPTVQLGGVAWVPDDPDAHGRPAYFGDVVVRDDCDIATFADLAGTRIGCNDPVSLSGNYALRFALADRGLDPESFARLEFTGGHHASLDQVISGELDAAVVDSVVRITRARSDGDVAALRVVERLGPWPVQPLVVHAGASSAEVDALAARLLEANDDPRVGAELAAAGLTSLVQIDPEHYEPVRAAMARLPGT